MESSSSLLGKYAAHLCHDFSSTCDDIYITHSKTFCKQSQSAHCPLDFLVLVLKSGELIRLMICDTSEPWKDHQNIVLKEIAENLLPKLGKSIESILDENIFHCVIFSDIKNSNANDIKDLTSFQTQKCTDGVYKIVLNKDLIHQKVVSFVSNFIIRNDDKFLKQNDLPENILNVTLTINRKELTLLKALHESPVTVSSTLIELSVFNRIYYTSWDVFDFEFDFGLLLMRKAAPKIDCPKIVENDVVESIEEVTETTRILKSDTAEFDEVCKLRDNVHEVEWVDYYLKLIRSKKGRPVFRKYLNKYPIHDDNAKPRFNICVVEGIGKTSYCQTLQSKLFEEDNKRVINCLNEHDLKETFSNIEHIHETLVQFSQMKTKTERILFDELVNEQRIINLFVDNLHKLNIEDQNIFIQFIHGVHKQFPNVAIWVMATEKVKDHLENYLGMACFQQLSLLYSHNAMDLIKKRIPEISEDSLQQLWNKISEENSIHEFDPFYIALCVDNYKANGLDCSYFEAVLFENYVQCQLMKTLKSDEDLKTLEDKAMKASFDMIFNGGSCDVLNSTFVEGQQSRIAEYLAGKYVTKMPKVLLPQILPLKSSGKVLSWFDKILFKNFPTAYPIIIGNGCYDQKSLVADEFQRTLAHLTGIYMIYGLPIEDFKSAIDVTDCLFAWTPIRWAEERGNWCMVNNLLEIEMSSKYLHKLKNMTTDEINEIFPEVFLFEYPNLVSYIFSVRNDVLISQKMLSKMLNWNFKTDTIKSCFALAIQQNITQHFQYDDCYMGSALHHAVINYTDLEIIRELVEKLNFSITKKNCYNDTPIALARSLDIIKYFLKSCDDKPQDDDKIGIFLNACEYGDIDVMQFCLRELQTDVFGLGKGKTTAMHNACQSNKFEAVKLLYDSGFKDLNVQNESGETPIYKLTYNVPCSIEIVNFFIENGANLATSSVNVTNFVDDLMYMREDVKTLQLLIKNGAKFSLRALFENYSVEQVKEIDEMCTINFNEGSLENGWVYLPLFEQSGEEIFKYIAGKCNVNQKDASGVTPFLKTISIHNWDIVKILLDNGGDIHDKDNDGQTALHYSIMNHNYDNLLQLDINESTLNDNDNNGKPIVHHLFEHMNEARSKYLIERGMNVNATDKMGRTVLHVVMIDKEYDFQSEIIYILETLKVDPSILDNRNRLAIHYLVETDVLNAIRAYGERRSFDFNAKDENGKNILDLAKSTAARNCLLQFKRSQMLELN